MLTLTEFFELQSTLNKRVGLNDAAFQSLFMNGEIVKPGSAAYNKQVTNAGRWIDDILKAMHSEMEELRNCTYWKHWCSEAQAGERYKLKDLTAARKEVIDILHFWISLAQILGMSPDMVSDMYAAKLAKNVKRQDDGYSIEQKDLALYLWQRYPDDNPMGYSGLAESLEDMPEDVAKHYLNWAKKELARRKDKCQFPSRYGKGCMWCEQEDCNQRRYLNTLENQNDIPVCSKCGRKCEVGYAMTGEGPICGRCV